MGLPLAVALAERMPTTGFDVNKRRIDELQAGHAQYLELGHARLRELVATGGMLADLKGALGGAADWTL